GPAAAIQPLRGTWASGQESRSNVDSFRAEPTAETGLGPAIRAAGVDGRVYRFGHAIKTAEATGGPVSRWPLFFSLLFFSARSLRPPRPLRFTPSFLRFLP